MKTFKTKVYLNAYAEAYCKRAFGVRRHIWNWALAKSWEVKKATNRFPSNFDLDKIYRQYLAEQKDKGFVWLAEQITSPVLMQEVMKDIRMSFARCHKDQYDFDVRRLARLHRKPKRKPKKKHPNKYKKIQPKFKRRDDPEQSFRYALTLERIGKPDSDHIFSLQTATRGKRCLLRTAESLAFLRKPGVKLCTVSVKYEAGAYWLCVSYEKPNHKKQGGQTMPKIGMDLGVVKSVVAFDGKQTTEHSFNTSNSIKSEALAKKLNARMSKCTRGSRRYNELRELYNKRMARSARQREAALEDYTSFVAKNYKEVVVDTFSFEGAKLVADNDELYHSMTYQFKLRLEQKVTGCGGIYREVEHKKGIKTTRKCAFCGSAAVEVDTTSDRKIHCRCCGTTIDRDENAARNCFNL